MRCTSDVLQLCQAAYDLTCTTEIYSFTGNPDHSDVQKIINPTSHHMSVYNG